ncbi:type II secretion system protein GspC [Aurantivibrio plasticivorans]
MATGSNVADSVAGNLQRFDPIISKIRQVPASVWRKAGIAVLSVWLVYTLSELFWVIMPTPPVAEPTLTIPSNITFSDNVSNSVSVDIESLRSLALFGELVGGEEVVNVGPSGIEQEAVDTKLNLKLVGTVASSDENLAKAFIQDGSKQETFGPGEDLTLGPRGVKLAKVMVDRVILDNNGRYETLWLYQGKDDFQSAGRSQRYVPPSRSAPRAARETNVDDDPEEIANARDFASAVLPTNGQSVPSAAQIKTVNELINVNMHREDGQFIGFKINPKRNPELFAELGLQPNDIVTAVNNIGLDSTSRAMEVYRSLSTSSQASLEILRDGVTVNVDVDLE